MKVLHEAWSASDLPFCCACPHSLYYSFSLNHLLFLIFFAHAVERHAAQCDTFCFLCGGHKEKLMVNCHTRWYQWCFVSEILQNIILVHYRSRCVWGAACLLCCQLFTYILKYNRWVCFPNYLLMTNKEELSDLMSMAKCHVCLGGKWAFPKCGSLIQIFTKDLRSNQMQKYHSIRL